MTRVYIKRTREYCAGNLVPFKLSAYLYPHYPTPGLHLDTQTYLLWCCWFREEERGGEEREGGWEERPPVSGPAVAGLRWP